MMKKRFSLIAVVAVLIAATFIVGCNGGEETGGTLQFYANGEDFVRQGFVSKDGWSISFDHVYVVLDDVAAYQTDPPYDPHEGSDIEAEVMVGLEGLHTVDLAEGDEDALPIRLGDVQAGVGHYNAVSWKMAKAPAGPAEGYSLVIMGTATKDGESIDFTINVEDEYGYACGEYVGDERKGIVQDGATADVEMTFHFDHIFGDAGTPLDDSLNVGAVGFEPFSVIAQDGELNENMAGLQEKLSLEAYEALVTMLPTLGHVGEGHCHCE
ncbi:MAG: DUF4382 domain-containing protein [Chloroflexota bacterium]|nr:DUF4382 domain-containing protein [Chloroflexota bacterium]